MKVGTLPRERTTSPKGKWRSGMHLIEATGLDGSTDCGVCGKPLILRVTKNGEIISRGETVWHEAWSTKPKCHISCCDKQGRPLCTPADHDALRTNEAWPSLLQRKDWEMGDGEILEQADCPKCGSTLARSKATGK